MKVYVLKQGASIVGIFEDKTRVETIEEKGRVLINKYEQLSKDKQYKRITEEAAFDELKSLVKQARDLHPKIMLSYGELTIQEHNVE